MKVTELTVIALLGLLIVDHSRALIGRRRPAAAPVEASRAAAEPRPESRSEEPAPFAPSAFVANQVALAVVEPGTPLDELTVSETGTDVQWLESRAKETR